MEALFRLLIAMRTQVLVRLLQLGGQGIDLHGDLYALLSYAQRV